MNPRNLFSTLFILIVVVLLVFYWFIPTNTLEFEISNSNSNFSVDAINSNMQFYENMRFPKKEISYKIHGCPLGKKGEMQSAFEILENKTMLEFYSVLENEEIYVSCDSGTKIKEGLFIAGEGGPTNITKSGEFNVITRGTILLIRDSGCAKPNIAIHELLHVLGFNHSQNPSNIMYPVSKCSQTIGDDMIKFIDEIYSYPPYSDLLFENISAVKKGTYFDINMTLRNSGLKDSGEFEVFIYADDKEIHDVDSESLDIGAGRLIVLSNVFSLQKNLEELKFVINYSGKELSKDNNVKILKIKK